jgi:transposase
MGPVCARPLVLERPELGTVRHQCLAAFMGVVPFNRDSGILRGHRPI